MAVLREPPVQGGRLSRNVDTRLQGRALQGLPVPPTGAVLSLDATSVRGMPIPTLHGVTREAWASFFPREPFDEGTGLPTTVHA
jgi:hypothetical protein